MRPDLKTLISVTLAAALLAVLPARADSVLLNASYDATRELYKDLSRAAFLREARKLVPSLTDDMVEESFAGVMAQVFLPDGSAAKDFIYERGLLGNTTLSLRNAPSPAATASFAIAERLIDMAQEDFRWAPEPAAARARSGSR